MKGNPPLEIQNLNMCFGLLTKPSLLVATKLRRRRQDSYVTRAVSNFNWIRHHEKFMNERIQKVGRGCGAVGRAVASDAVDPQIESSHQQDFFDNLSVTVIVQKRRNKRKRGRDWPVFFLK